MHVKNAGNDCEVDENQRTPRRRVLKGGRIVFNNKTSTIDCTARNISDGGAMLLIPNPLGVPDSFLLFVGEDPPRSCTVRWRSATAIGVSFDERAVS
jgi:hypothetical protein